MDKESASRLLDETFNSDFEINRFIRFVKELFNNFTVRQKECTKFIASQYKEYIASFDKIGDYENARKSMEVLVVRLNKTSSRDRARTMQRNFVANWLEKMQKDAALVAFYGDDPQDWRFSFVKMEYQLTKDEDGKVSIVKELTPARRYSFLVGVNEPNHTCRQQFKDLVMREDANPSLDEIENVFSIEKVTKEFFIDYKELYFGLEESLKKVIEQDSYVKQEFKEKNISTIDFAKKLLGQIVFIYFLQKKGWLGVGVNKEWGSGPKDFMRRLFGDKKKGIKPMESYKNFFNDILEPLFYEALANPREADDGYYSRFNCKIPFLNGGLFEPINNYDWAGTEIVLSNSVFEKILTTFDQYNFTVKEDEPLEKEVAIDPEMLGKVFENLLDIKDRKSTGRYYTPREIVHYMCQQSLINYLATNTPISIPRDDVEKFIQLGDFALDLTIRAQEQKRQHHGKTFDIDESLAIPKPIEDIYKEIDRLLKDIKIVDPAVGSGAFPIGMMNEIVKARSILTLFFDEDEQRKRTVYKFKRETIENSLYGVDIDSSAVDIAKLRFWLSLIVDEEDIKTIKPLPNLDHKIMCGNSLLEEFGGVKLFDEKLLIEIPKDYSYQLEQIDREVNKLNQELHDIHTGKKADNGRTKQIQRELKNLKREKEQILSGPNEDVPQVTLDEALQKRIRESQKKLKELKNLQKKFFNEQNRKLKRQYAEEIDTIEWELIEETLKEEGNEEAMQKLQQYKKKKSKPFFLWKLYFSEIFQRDNPGFDVVIANPPYVSAWNAEKQYKKYYLQNYKSSTGHYDLYVLFMEKSLDILRNNGVSAFITSNKYFAQKYGAGIRTLLLNNSINRIINFNCNVFETATVETAITIFIKQKDFSDNEIKILNINSSKDYSFTNFQNIKQDFLKTLPNNSFRLNLNDKKVKVLKKIENDTILLEDICYIDCGIVPHSSKFNLKKEYFIHKNNENNKFVPYLEGKDIFPNYITERRFLDYQPSKHHRPKVKELFEKTKILIKDIGGKTRITSAIDLDKNYTNDTIRICVLLWDLRNVSNSQLRQYNRGKNIALSKNYDIYYIKPVISSKLMSFYFFELICGGLHIYPNEIRLFPIKKATLKEQNKIKLVQEQIIKIAKDDDYLDNPDKQAKVKRLEEQIDKLVYELYELTTEEIEVVKEFNKEK